MFDQTVTQQLHREVISYPQTGRAETLAGLLDMHNDGIPRIDWEEWNDREVDKICGAIFSK